ncbi:hypothetical protein KRP22_005838 [Phytophthora ramorum]|uniref:DNA mismatch repair protein msh-2 n=1 Tax=Phytophthora ramorum TaxID=164328 RepID=UPI0030A34ABC|nr:DNA mismatch repair protein msh-2 [Phytophthora ramorum]KAH7507936.1 DNA mismatch repair protein msh-2 [Phytophthora ramorum]
MQLNSSAREVFVASGASTSRLPSLLNLLAPSCSTKRGRQRLKQWLECPCIDSDVLNERLGTVEAVISAVSGDHPVLWKLSSLFQHVQSYERGLSLFTSSGAVKADDSVDMKLSLSDFSGLEVWITELFVLVENSLADEDLVTELGNLFSTHLRPIHQLSSGSLQPFCALVQEMIGGVERGEDFSRHAMEVDGEGGIKSSSSQLQELRTQIRECEMEAAVAAKQAAALLCIAEDRIKVVYADDEQRSISSMGIVLRVSRQDSHRIQQQSGKGLSVIRASRASGIWFSTPTIDSLGAKWKSLRRSYEDAEANLVRFLTVEFQAHFQGGLHELAVRVAELDVLVSFALVSYKHKFIRATMSDVDSPSLRLRGIFDPFVQQSTGGANVTGDSEPDVAIELSAHDGKSFLLLDGHQESTQTSLLQLLGIVVLLNQLGCFVPCKEAVLPVFDAIFLRTGAYDQQLYGYSTFMTEMREMSHIFSTMTHTSLVLIEDLCRGTATSEGLALALSMCLHLMETKTMTCFSSQWRELTDKLLNQPNATTPTHGYEDSRKNSRTNRDDCNPSQNFAEFEKQMRDSDLPPDLIALVREEIGL